MNVESQTISNLDQRAGGLGITDGHSAQNTNGIAAPPGVTDLLGETTIQAITDRVVTLERWASLAQIENPFAQDSGTEIDLGFLTSEQAEQIRNFNPDRWVHTCVRSETNLRAARSWRGALGVSVKVSSLRKRLYLEGRNALSELVRKTDLADPQIEEVDQGLHEVLENYGARGTALDPDTITSFWEILNEARRNLPFKSSSETVENLLAAAVEIDKFHDRHKDESRLARAGIASEAMSIRENRLKACFADARELKERSQRLHGLGSGCHKRLIVLAKDEQLREANRLLDVLSGARSRLPRLADLEGVGLDVALAAGQYLATQVELVQSTMHSLRPGLLTRPDVQARIRGIATVGRSPVSEASPSQTQEAIAEGVDLNVTEARDVLRGGRRLKPPKGQTQNWVHEKADALRALRNSDGTRLLEPEESGILVSILTGRFGEFVDVLNQLNGINSANLNDIPLERRTIIQLLRRFDLNEALGKIARHLNDSSERTLLMNVLGFDGLTNVQQAVAKASTAPTRHLV